MHHGKICEGVEWNDMVQDGFQVRTLLKTVMNHLVEQKAGISRPAGRPSAFQAGLHCVLVSNIIDADDA
jgi:hypothetical protein